VVLLFVLSGTLLSLSLARRRSLRWQSVLEFYCRRVFRLFPLLAIVALASGLADKLYFEDVVYDFTTSWMDMHFKSDASLREVVRNATFCWLAALGGFACRHPRGGAAGTALHGPVHRPLRDWQKRHDRAKSRNHNVATPA
jgi:hypothetical protein